MLAVTDEELELEFEMDLAASGEPLKTCPRCGWQTHRTSCRFCMVGDEPLLLSGDSQMDDMRARAEAGEKIDIGKEIFGDDFVPVIPGEKP